MFASAPPLLWKDVHVHAYRCVPPLYSFYQVTQSLFIYILLLPAAREMFDKLGERHRAGSLNAVNLRPNASLFHLEVS